MALRVAQREDGDDEDDDAEHDDADPGQPFATLAASLLPGQAAPTIRAILRVQCLKPRYPVDVPTADAAGLPAIVADA